ncbi:RecX family transcriptional regulator [Candidatus Saccharibacteria bacterium]|nr:RecX family transcriptional regulator [Candidatus Saccharibacteria bacterium]
MEIYKLSDKIDEKSSKSSDDSEILKITDLKQGVKNPDRVNVFVNDDFAFSLDVAQVVDLKIKKGRIITEEELVELTKASEFGKLYQRTLEWVLMRPRSVRETSDYLSKKIFEKKLDNSFLKIIIEKLEKKNYLDDYRFAKWYIGNRFFKKGVSSKRLKMELFKKGISKEIIEQVLVDSDRDDVSEIKKVILKKRSKYPDDEKLISYLCRQGFPFELSREMVLESSEMD